MKRQAGRGPGPLEPVLAMLRREQLDVALQQRIEVDRLGVKLERPARLDAREIQQLADDAAEGARLGVEVDEAAVRLLGRQRGAEQQLAEPLERGQRRSQLVRDHREKLGLGLVELPQPARRRLDLFRELLREALLAQCEPRVLHRQADVHRELRGGRAGGAR